MDTLTFMLMLLMGLALVFVVAIREIQQKLNRLLDILEEDNEAQTD